MPKVSFQKKDIPFLFGGVGQLSVDTGDLQINHPLDEAIPALFKAGFDAGGSQDVSLGGDDTVKLGVAASTSVELVSVFSSAQGGTAELLKANGIGQFFERGANADKVVLGLVIGGSAQFTASGSFNYSALKSGITLNAGGNGGYSYLRALDKTLSIEQLLPEFFSAMRLPEQTRGPMQAGEAISLRYGGYLKLAAEVSAGYQLAGTKSIALGGLALSEKYGLSVIGKVGLTAGIAGQFSIVVTGADDLDGWARVRVHRQKSRSFGIAADVNVGFQNQLEHLPPTANEFLGAALGVNARNFLSLFEKARDLADFEKFKAAIDGLAQRYVSEYVKKGFDQLASIDEFKAFLNRVNLVVASYEQVGDRAVALFDRYFEQLPELTAFLQKIQELETEGLEKLRKEINPMTFNMLSQLTDGDPLAFLLKQVTIGGKKVGALAELKGRSGSVLNLITAAAHEEIRNVVALAKQSFGIDKFFRELAGIDTVEELQSVANEKAGQFVSRLVGRTLDSATNLKEALKEVRAVLDNLESFKNKLYANFKEALNSSYRVALHAEYSRASESDALVDVLINLSENKGADLLGQAGKGNFEEILICSDTNLVRLREGVFTHRVRRESAFKVNIIGWHLNYNYAGFDRVITETEQRLIPSDRGITILTTADLRLERMRKRQTQEMHMNFLLRALGESAKVVRSDGRTTAYLIEALSSLTARYELNFTDADTTTPELQDYLSFARDLGLDKQGATLESLDPLLPRAANGGFGNVRASYDVRFGEKSVTALLAIRELADDKELLIRTAMRRILLSNYLKSAALHDVAFAYATPGVFSIFDQEGFAQFGNHFERAFKVQLFDSSIAAPATVVLDRTELQFLITLYNIENSMIDAIKDLVKVLAAGVPIDPPGFEKKLGRFGDALQDFDRFDQTTNDHGIGTSTIFSMFDMLVRLASPDGAANVAVLRLTTTANQQEVEKLFLSDEAAEVERAPVTAARSATP